MRLKFLLSAQLILDLAILSSEQVDKFAKLADRAKILDPLDKEQGLVSLYAEICQDRCVRQRESG